MSHLSAFSRDKYPFGISQGLCLPSKSLILYIIYPALLGLEVTHTQVWAHLDQQDCEPSRIWFGREWWTFRRKKKPALKLKMGRFEYCKLRRTLGWLRAGAREA
mmetsp:Transcript_9102/g.16806  ORF Transcript_9102/g.16806 Transcript_9102/m.16806 type:complete len:104 (+) Transcript_9102:49-360(+)